MSHDAERVEVRLTFDAHWCARHLEPFRSNWPEGASVGMLRLFDHAIRHPEIERACGAVDGHRGDARQLHRVLREFSPLCCLLGDDEMARVYAEAGIELP